VASAFAKGEAVDFKTSKDFKRVRETSGDLKDFMRVQD
jgi:hypothetical protein